MYIIIIIILITLIFYFINNLLKINEKMSMREPILKNYLEKNGYEIDTEKYIIKKCVNDNCYTKQYKTRYFNDIESHFIAKNKPVSNTIFLENEIPVPKHIIINNSNKNTYLDNDYNIKFPCVLKPVDGMQGKDVNTFIKNKKQFNNILINLLKQYNEIMMENQVYGDNYRIFVFNNKIMDIIKREQPFIIGNDKNSVEELINEKIESQKLKRLYPTTNIDWDYINEQGYKKNDIIENKKKIFITNTINFHNGANPVRIDINVLPKENIDMFIKAHKLAKLECSGIDYMSYDISLPYYENDGHIIEINDMVDTKIHIDADNGSKPYFLYENILKSFEDNI